MNSADRFRRLALSFPEAHESSHCGSADFRLGDRIFATLAFVTSGKATLKLSPDQQQAFLADLPEITEPAPGGWGRMGMTLIRLDAPEEVLRGALAMAYNNVKSRQKTPASKKGSKRSAAGLP